MMYKYHYRPNAGSQKETTDEEQSENLKHLTIDKEFNRKYTKRNFWVNTIIASATLLVFGLSYKQFDATKKALKIAADANNISSAALAHSKVQDSIARIDKRISDIQDSIKYDMSNRMSLKSILTSIRQFELVNEPNLVFGRLSYMNFKPGDPFKIIYNIRNIGSLPAKIKAMDVDFQIIPTGETEMFFSLGLPFTFNKKNIRTGIYGPELPPGDSEYTYPIKPSIISEDLYKNVATGQNSIYAIGYIQYNSGLNREKELTFVGRIVFESNNNVITPTGFKYLYCETKVISQ